MRAAIFAALLCLIVSPATGASISFQAAQPIAARCEVSALRFPLPDGTVREERFDAPVVIGSAPVVKEVAVPADARSIAAVAQGCWVETIRNGSTAAVVRAWPLATLTAHYEKTKAEPSVARAAFIDVKASEGDEVQELACSRDGNIARCSLPALRPVHVRVEWNGFAPVYTKNVSLREGGTLETPPVALVAAYGLEGDVIAQNGRPIHNARIRLIPATAGELPLSERVLRTATALSDEKGHYRITGVAVGMYRVVSQAEGRADSVVDAIEVADRDLRLSPLVHKARARIEILLNPPVAPDATPWRLKVRRRGTRQHEVVVVADVTASAAGFWHSDPLDSGEYTVTVLNAHGSEVMRKELVLDGADERIVLTLAGIAVRGRVLSGNDGVAAGLKFSSASGQSVRAEAAKDGTFTAVFPTAGSWQVEVTTPPGSSLRVRLPAVEIRDGETGELQLRLPGGRVEGVVLNQQRQPAAAVITVRRDKALVAQVMTGSDGRFTIAHLAEAPHTIEADAKIGFASPVAVDLSEGNAKDVELILIPKPVAKGVVIGPSGRPLSGAVVRIVDLLTGRYTDTIADAEGLFSREMSVAGLIDIVVIAPPAPVTARRFAPAQWQGQNLTIAVPPVSAILRFMTLRVPPWPVVRSADGAARSLGLFVMPEFGGSGREPRREFVDGAFQFVIEPGAYVVCGGNKCRDVQLAPGASVTLDFLPSPEELEKSRKGEKP